MTQLLFLLIRAARKRFPSGLGEDPETLSPAALVAGLFHDIGYPLALLRTLSTNEHQSHWSAVLRYELQALRGTVDRSRIAQRLVQYGVTQDPVSWIEREINMNCKKAHAFLSGVWLLGFKEELLRIGSTPGTLAANAAEAVEGLRRLESALERAACAAFFHHIHEHDESRRMRARLRECPLMVLLQLADVLQEWGRPIVVRTSSGAVCFVVPNTSLTLQVFQDGRVLAVPGRERPGKATAKDVAESWKQMVLADPTTVKVTLGWDDRRDSLVPESVSQLRLAGWEPWRPCKDVPKALRSFDPEAIALLRNLETLTD